MTAQVLCYYCNKCVMDRWCLSSNSWYSLHQGWPHITSPLLSSKPQWSLLCTQPNHAPVTHFILFVSLSITCVHTWVCLPIAGNLSCIGLESSSSQSKGGRLLVYYLDFFNLLPVNDLLLNLWLIEAWVDCLCLAIWIMTSCLSCSSW
jgi:hypothetical protein